MRLLNIHIAQRSMARVRLYMACMFIAIFTLQIILPAIRDVSGLISKSQNIDNPYESDNNTADEDGQAPAKNELAKVDVFLTSTILAARQQHFTHRLSTVFDAREHMEHHYTPEIPTPPPDGISC